MQAKFIIEGPQKMLRRRTQQNGTVEGHIGCEQAETTGRRARSGRNGLGPAVTWAAALIIGLLISISPAVAQRTPGESACRDIDRILQSLRRPDAGLLPSAQQGPEAGCFLKRADGYLRILAAPAGGCFPVSLTVRTDPLATARDFLEEHEAAFGLESELFDFVPKAIEAGTRHTHLRLDQTYAGIPVFAAQMVIQLNEDGDVEYISSDVMTADEGLGVEGDWLVPAVTRTEAEEIGVGTLMAENAGMQFQTEPATRMIYQPSVVGNEGPGRVVWLVRVVSLPDPWVAEQVLIDAQSGEVVLRCTLVRNALHREIYDADNSLLGVRRRTDGTPPYLPVADVDRAYDGLEYAYNFYRDLHTRDGVDGEGSLLKAFVRICYPHETCPWRNIGWIGQGHNCLFLGEGFVADDIIAHEFAHGVTEYAAGLVYMNESGSIDESLADIGGELVDLTNGAGDDSDAVKWQIGEDLPGGALRDMSRPSARPNCQADRRRSENWKSLPPDVPPSAGNDYGYVHNNCGVGNKLFCLLVDGGTFNGGHVDAMGVSQVEALYYEVQTNHLLPCAADYNDLYFALTRAAANREWTAIGRLNLERACRAVEIAAGQEESIGGIPAAGRGTPGMASILCAAGEPPARSDVEPTGKTERETTDTGGREPMSESSRADLSPMPDQLPRPGVRQWQTDDSEASPEPVRMETISFERPSPGALERSAPEPATSRQMKTGPVVVPPTPQLTTDSPGSRDAAERGDSGETLKLRAWVYPQTLARSDRTSGYVFVLIRLPGVPPESLDWTRRVALYPEGIEAVVQVAYPCASQAPSGTAIWAAFDREALLATVLEDGHTTLRIAGILGAGRRFDAVGELLVTP